LDTDDQKTPAGKRKRKSLLNNSKATTTPPIAASTAKKSASKQYTTSTLSNNLSNHVDNSYAVAPRSSGRRLLDRDMPKPPETDEIDMKSVSETLKSKNITASKSKFGFLGLGIMGSGIVKNLINSGHDVTIWNRTSEKCNKFEAAGAKVAATPADVIDASDITFCCVSDPMACKEVSDFY
jgi:3-hydroxyisobutyrate dehydrogenase